MRLIPEIAHCGSFGHVLHWVMCFDKLKVLCKYWMIYRMFQELSSLLRDLVPELILSQNAIYTCVQFARVQEL